jgi:hypothetical protein
LLSTRKYVRRTYCRRFVGSLLVPPANPWNWSIPRKYTGFLLVLDVWRHLQDML